MLIDHLLLVLVLFLEVAEARGERRQVRISCTTDTSAREKLFGLITKTLLYIYAAIFELFRPPVRQLLLFVMGAFECKYFICRVNFFTNFTERLLLR